MTSALGLDRPGLIGHSLGGFVVASFAARFGAATVISLDQTFELSQLAAAVQPFSRTILDGRGVDLYLEMSEQQGLGALPPAWREQLLQTRRQLDGAVIAGVWGRLLKNDRHELDALVSGALSNLDAPLLSLHWYDVPSGYETWLRSLIRGAQLEVWNGAEHFCHVRDPDRVANRVLEHLHSL